VILINLLPHREARRQQRKQAFFAGIGFAVLVGAGIVLAWYTFVNTQISTQEEHNQFLTSEIKRLDAQIADVATLKAEIEALKARQKAVEDLQADRNMPVYLLNELVKQTPEGIYFSTVKQDGQTLTVNGIAQTQERISELLRNTAYNSAWLVKPELVESKATTVTGANREQKRLFDFSMRVGVKRPQDLKPAEANASAPIAAKPAASAPAPKKA